MARARHSGAISLALALTSLGCQPARGPVNAGGYRHGKYDYGVSSVKGGQLLPRGWQLDNFSRDRNGHMRPKDGGVYSTTYLLDANADGAYEEEYTDYTYDLRFVHLEHDGVIFLRTIPVSSDMQRKKLPVLMGRYVDRLAGAKYDVASLPDGSSVMEEKRYAAKVVTTSPSTLAGLEAFSATLDIANLDQLEVDPDARSLRLQVVFLHTPFQAKMEVQERRGIRDIALPVVMFAGYANQPAAFDAALPDFHDFLGRITIGGRAGFVTSTATGAVESD